MGNTSVEKATQILLTMGVRGTAKSLYYSQRQTSRPDRLLFGKRVITRIHPDARFDLESRFLMGLYGSAATHPGLGKSKFLIEAHASLHVPTSGFARVGPCCVIHIEGDFTMGDSYINSHSRVICGESVTIGDGCAIAWGVDIVDIDRHTVVYEDGSESDLSAPIVIGDDVWIGSNVGVKKGVTIGDNVVVASGSSVTKDVPPNTLVGGTPAEPIRNISGWNY